MDWKDHLIDYYRSEAIRAWTFYQAALLERYQRYISTWHCTEELWNQELTEPGEHSRLFMKIGAQMIKTEENDMKKTTNSKMLFRENVKRLKAGVAVEELSLIDPNVSLEHVEQFINNNINDNNSNDIVDNSSLPTDEVTVIVLATHDNDSHNATETSGVFNDGIDSATKAGPPLTSTQQVCNDEDLLAVQGEHSIADSLEDEFCSCDEDSPDGSCKFQDPITVDVKCSIRSDAESRAAKKNSLSYVQIINQEAMNSLQDDENDTKSVNSRESNLEETKPKEAVENNPNYGTSEVCKNDTETSTDFTDVIVTVDKPKQREGDEVEVSAADGCNIESLSTTSATTKNGSSSLIKVPVPQTSSVHAPSKQAESARDSSTNADQTPIDCGKSVPSVSEDNYEDSCATSEYSHTIHTANPVLLGYNKRRFTSADAQSISSEQSLLSDFSGSYEQDMMTNSALHNNDSILGEFTSFSRQGPATVPHPHCSLYPSQQPMSMQAQLLNQYVAAQTGYPNTYIEPPSNYGQGAMLSMPAYGYIQPNYSGVYQQQLAAGVNMGYQTGLPSYQQQLGVNRNMANQMSAIPNYQQQQFGSYVNMNNQPANESKTEVMQRCFGTNKIAFSTSNLAFPEKQSVGFSPERASLPSNESPLLNTNQQPAASQSTECDVHFGDVSGGNMPTSNRVMFEERNATTGTNQESMNSKTFSSVEQALEAEEVLANSSVSEDTRQEINKPAPDKQPKSTTKPAVVFSLNSKIVTDLPAAAGQKTLGKTKSRRKVPVKLPPKSSADTISSDELNFGDIKWTKSAKGEKSVEKNASSTTNTRTTKSRVFEVFSPPTPLLTSPGKSWADLFSKPRTPSLPPTQYQGNKQVLPVVTKHSSGEDSWQTVTSKKNQAKKKGKNKLKAISECSICFENLVLLDRHRLDCGHDEFHHKCISEWITKEQSATCPICRGPVKTD